MPTCTDRSTGAASLGFDVVVWNGLMAPAGTPRDVVARLNQELKRELDAPELKDRLLAQGFEPAWSTPEAFGQKIAADIARWAKVVQVSGAKVE